ncbi:MAG: hypothetical protein LBH58_02970 [Tannerellaceae bacterium]|nr:hypothetical protein [Tannerellaceae bacterium]
MRGSPPTAVALPYLNGSAARPVLFSGKEPKMPENSMVFKIIPMVMKIIRIETVVITIEMKTIR